MYDMEAPQRKVASSASSKEYKPGVRVFRIGCASFLQKAKKDDKREEETGQPPREHVHQPFLDSVSNICITRRRPRLTFHWNCGPVNLQDCKTHIIHTNIMYIVHTQQYSTHNLELAVLALARIMCANIHSQNGTAILAQELLSRK